MKALERWVLRLPDEEVADAIELFTIGLDASRKSRWVVLRTIDDELRVPGAFLPHEERVSLLRWIVRARETDAAIRAKLRELHDASAPQRSRIIDALGAGEDAPAPSIENAHPIFVQAWRAAPPDARPSGPVHRGEPEPVIGGKSSVRLVISLARRVAHLVPRGERKTFDRLLALAVTAVGAGRAAPRLDEAIVSATRDGAAGLARLACIEARASLTRPDMAGIAARPAASRVVSLLQETDGPDAVRAFLSDLDEDLRRLDVAHALDLRRKQPSRPIARAIYRGVEQGVVVLWLAALEGGALGLLVKEGRHWAWREGGRDEVLASVPDDHFERAVMAARG